jgi:hypothetical protein
MVGRRSTAFRGLGLAQGHGLPEDFLDAFQGDEELRAAFGDGEVVHLVDDDEAHRGQVLAQRVAVEQELHGLRRGDEQVGRLAGLAGAFRRRGVAVADADAQVQRLAPGLEAAEEVPVEGAQRRDVQDLEAHGPRLAGGVEAVPFGKDAAEDGQQAGLGLAVAGGGDEQDVLAGQQGREGLVLRGGEALPALVAQQLHQPGMEALHGVAGHDPVMRGWRGSGSG